MERASLATSPVQEKGFLHALEAVALRELATGKGHKLMTPGSCEFGDQPHQANQDAERRLGNLRQAPRCGAKTRAGTPCQCPAMRGRRRCRLHGGLSPGAPRGARNGNYTDGDWTAEAIEERRWARSLVANFAKGGTR